MGIQNLTGQTLGQYELRELLGVGGMGAVYRGYQANLKRYVAVKVMTGDLAKQPGYMERFTREAETSAALAHPNIIHIIDFGMQQGISYLVMELLTGGTLSERLAQRAREDDPLPSLGEVANLLTQIGSALDYAHSQGVIHRDIKPSNVMFDNHGNAYLVDFGIAKLAQATQGLTASGMVVGTWGYMAPEQWRADKLTAATDQYALAVMTYSLVTSHMPFEAATPAHVMHKHMTEMPTPPHALRPEVPAALTPVLERALAKNPDERFPTCTAFAQAFDSAIRGNTGEKTAFFTAPIRRSPAAEPSTVFTPSGSANSSPLMAPVTAERPIYKHPLTWGLLAVVVVLIGALIALMAGGGGDDAGNAAPTEAAQATATATTAPAIVILATETPTLPATKTPIVTSTSTVTATLLLSETPSDTLTPDLDATIHAEMALLQTETVQTAIAGWTATATRWTKTPTPDLKGTAAALLAQTQAAIDEQATQVANATLTRIARDQTATATLWTATPTPTSTPTATPTATNTATRTSTPTATPDPLDLAQNFSGSNDDWTPVVQEFDGVEMVLVPAGCFEMGSTDWEASSPVHEVCFEEPFWIDKYEVTNAQYRMCVEAGACTKPGDARYYDDPSYKNHPVVYVDWAQARAYAEWRGGSLPTEAQWEYAARGPDGLVYPWGDEFVGGMWCTQGILTVEQRTSAADRMVYPGWGRWI